MNDLSFLHPVTPTTPNPWLELVPGFSVRMTDRGAEGRWTVKPTQDLYQTLIEQTNITLGRDDPRVPARRSAIWSSRYAYLWALAESERPIGSMEPRFQLAVIAIRDAVVACRERKRACWDLMRAWAVEQRAAATIPSDTRDALKVA